MPKTSTNITWYLYFRGPVRQVYLLLTNQLAGFPAPILFRFAYFSRGGRLFCKLLRARAASRKPLFVSHEKFPPKNSKNGHNAPMWYLLYAGSITSNESRLLTKSNRFVKNGRVRKFLLTEITGPLPEVIPIFWSEEPTKISGIFALAQWQTSVVFMCRCTVAWQVRSWRVFLSFFYFYQSSMLLNYQSLVL